MYFRGRSPRKYIQHEGGTIPCTVKTMTCTDRPYRANGQISFSARITILYYSMYCTIAVQRKLPYARHCSYSSIV